MSGRMAARVRELDPRLKLAVGLAMGLLVWRAGAVGLGAYLVLLAGVLVLFWRQAPGRSCLVVHYLGFVAFWVLAKAGLDFLWGVPWPQLLHDGAWLGARLAVLVLTGLALALTTSSRQLGMAVNWALRPLLRDRAWQAALALALMVHFLPLAWQSLDQVRLGVRTRRVRGRFRRLLLTAQGVFRLLGRRAWDQAVAVAARGLDSARAWRPEFTLAAGSLAAGLAGVAGLVGLAFV